jgi:uncharacterized membrane protein
MPAAANAAGMETEWIPNGHATRFLATIAGARRSADVRQSSGRDMRLAKFTCAMLAGIAFAVTTAPALAGSFTTIDEAQNGFLTALSRDGHIAAGAYVAGGVYAGSWQWRQGQGGYDTPLNVASGMNAWAQPVAGSADDGKGNQVAALGYSDIETTGPVLIGAYPGAVPLDNFLSQAYGVSDDGTVVGLANDPFTNAIAFRWTATGGMTRLSVPRPNNYSRANGISGNGEIVYGWNDHDDGYRSGMIWLGNTPVEPHNYGQYGDAFGSPPGEALASNYDGSVVVGLGYWDDLLQSEAWRWTLATDAQPLGIITPGALAPYGALIMRYKAPGGWVRAAGLPHPDDWGDDPQSLAAAVSQDGNVVVGYSGTPYNQDAFIWTPVTGMMFLVDYAQAHGVKIPAGFLLYGANAVSADGKTIGGTGIDPTGTYVVPWILDLHDDPQRYAKVTAVGAISANDLVDGPFAGFPLGATVTMTFRVPTQGVSIDVAHSSDYGVRVASFQLSATYLNPVDYSHPTATETLDPFAQPELHLLNDAPRADSFALDNMAVSTAGQYLQFSVTNTDGALFDSEQIARVNRTITADAFDTANWTLSDGIHEMTIAPQWISVEDDMDELFSDGFEGN